jgi:AcrB/AcrD/AcrF family
VFVFLVLAAQYESWSLPLAVILVVPKCLLCSIVGVRLAGMEVNLFTQIGFVVLVPVGQSPLAPAPEMTSDTPATPPISETEISKGRCPPG